MIPFKVKLLTETAKAPTQENEGDLWDLYADDFCLNFNYFIFRKNLKDRNASMYKSINEKHIDLNPMGRVLVKTGISLELPIKYSKRKRIGKEKEELNTNQILYLLEEWSYKKKYNDLFYSYVEAYAVADIRPRSGLALKHGITVLNTPGTIDNSYRKEIGVILHNAGHEPYTITKGDKIAQMLIRPLYPSKMEIVESIEDTGRGNYGSTGK